MGFIKLAIKTVVPVPKIDGFKRYLFIGPHPDDIEIGAGATIARLAKEGKKISFLICADGRFGDKYSNGVTGDELAALREKEAIASAKALGVEDVRFLRLRDGAGYTQEELEKGIAGAVGEINPQIIFAPDPLSGSECHQDHLNVGFAARKIACFAPYGGIMGGLGAKTANVEAIAFYMTAKPNRFYASKKLLKKQLDAIFENHKSQYPEDGEDAASLTIYLTLRSAVFGMRSLSFGGAEGFRVLGKTHMHCLPEME